MDFIIQPMGEAQVHDTVTLLKTLACEMRELDTQKKYFQFQDYPEPLVREFVQKTLHDVDSMIYLALYDGEIIGFIGGQLQNNVLPFLLPPKIGYIFGAYIKKDYRNQGVMKALEGKISGFFKQKGLECVDLHVLTFNTAGHQSWNKLGYTPYREQRRKYLN